jgi:hypothetical protein
MRGGKRRAAGNYYARMCAHGCDCAAGVHDSRAARASTRLRTLQLTVKVHVTVHDPAYAVCSDCRAGRPRGAVRAMHTVARRSSNTFQPGALAHRKHGGAERSGGRCARHTERAGPRYQGSSHISVSTHSLRFFICSPHRGLCPFQFHPTDVSRLHTGLERRSPRMAVLSRNFGSEQLDGWPPASNTHVCHST